MNGLIEVIPCLGGKLAYLKQANIHGRIKKQETVFHKYYLFQPNSLFMNGGTASFYLQNTVLLRYGESSKGGEDKLELLKNIKMVWSLVEY